MRIGNKFNKLFNNLNFKSMKMENKLRTIGILFFLSIVLFVTSCTDGFIDKEIFTSSVKNSSLSSPDSIVFTPSADGTTIGVSWPIVAGAGGYKVTLYNTTSGTVVGTANQVVDEDTIQRTFDSESNYKAVVRTMDNSTLNNVAKGDSTVGYYGQTVYATIPDGTDLYTYFQANPVPSSSSTILYQLVPNGKYTMSGNVNFGLTTVKLRGDKTSHPTVTMSIGSTGSTTSFITDGAGANFVRINFDCSALSGNGFISFDPTINSAATSSTWGVIDNSTISLVSCKVIGLAVPLLSDGGQKYALATFAISDCIIGQNTATKNLLLGTTASNVVGFVKDLSFKNSTFYNTASSAAGYFLQEANGTYATKITNANWVGSAISLINCTLWNMCSAKKIMNFSGFNNLSGNSYTLKNNIFYDCSDKVSGYKISDPFGMNSTPSRTYNFNTYWITSGTATTATGSYPGFPIAETTIVSSGYDNSGTAMQTDPGLKSPSTLDFTVSGTSQINAQTGDPRWLPNSTIWK